MEPGQCLYDPRYEHDACDVGFVANIDGTKSHDIVTRGIRVLENLLHRGAAGGDEKTGDGAGILVQIPDDFLQRECGSLGLKLPPAGKYGVGMLFLPRDQGFAAQCRAIFELVVREEGLLFLGWRAIKSGRRDRHRALMIAALAASATFLACYLGYHLTAAGITR